MLIRNDKGKILIVDKNNFINDTLYHKKLYDLQCEKHKKNEKHITVSCFKPYNFSNFLVEKNTSLSSKYFFYDK